MTDAARPISVPAQSNFISVALCFAVSMLEGFDIQAIGVAAPKLAPELHLAASQMGWVFFASNLALVFGASCGGWLADKIGRKPIFVLSVAAFGAATFATAYAGTYYPLMAARALAGFGFGAALPNMMAVAADISRPERRASTATMMFCGMPLGGGLCAALTQTLPAGYDWRILFFVGGILPVVLAPALLLFMRETAARAQTGAERVDVLRALFGERRAPPTLLLWLAFFPTLLILYLILYWLPTLVVDKGLPRALAPQASMAFNFASVVGALILGWIVDRVGPRWPLTLAYAALIGALIYLARANGLPLIVALSAAAGFTLMGANYALYGVAAAYYPRALRGTGSGASIAIGRVGAIIGPLLPGLLLTTGASADEIIKLMAPAAGTAAVAVFLLGSFKPHTQD
ncbi:MAG TPA: MFS transporter [Caulobacterales bacterium]|nr:MFS transporter [Caulobacterales bacterium]